MSRITRVIAGSFTRLLPSMATAHCTFNQAPRTPKRLAVIAVPHQRNMSQFVTVDVIGKKRDKKELTTEEIKFVVDGFTSGAIADYQMSALLMAIVVIFM
jgi:hypothetical protein